MIFFLRARLWLAAVVAVCLVSPDGARAALNRWSPLGDPGAFGVMRVTFDPRDPATVYAETQGSGLWRSTDGGASWVPISEGLAGYPRDLEVDAAGDLYATAITDSLWRVALWRSADRGDTWTQVQEPQDFFDFGFQIVADPAVPGTLYWARSESIFRSTDGGLTFDCFRGLCASGSFPEATGIGVDPLRPATIFVTDASTLYKTADGGASWSEPLFIRPFGDSEVVDRILATTAPDLLYAWRGRFGVQDPYVPLPCFARSDDGGKSWKGFRLGERCAEPAIDPAHPRTVRIVVGAEPLLWTSGDGGETWTKTPAPAFGSVFSHPTDPDVLFLAGDTGLYKSTDGGATWASSSRGMRSSGVLLLVASPRQRGVLYAGVVAPEAPFSWVLQKSTNAGQSWTKLPLRNPVALAIDPRDPEHLFAASGQLTGTAGASGRILESVDGGRSWRVVAGKTVARLLVDPRDSEVLYAGTSDSGLLKSTDGGHTWRSANRGLPLVTHCEEHYCPPNTVAVIAADPRDPRTLVITFAGNLYRSTDQGETWVWSSNRLPPGAVQALAFDPARPGVVYAAAGFLAPLAEPGAVFKSVDGGRRWTPTAALPGTRVQGQPVPAAVRDLVVTPGGVFVATYGRGVVRSTDGGRSWSEAAPGLPLPWVVELEADARFPERLYAGTQSLGLYSARFPR